MSSRHFVLYAEESGYWWSVVRRRRILKLSEKFPPSGNPGLGVDLGCGGGALLSSLRESGINLVGVDYSENACRVCSVKGLKVVNADVLHLPFRDNVFSRVFVLDLLEHLSDENATLKEISRVCNKGGVVFFSVPAFNCLRSKRDRLLGHYRRYNKRSIEEGLLKHGFMPLYGGYMFNGLFLPIFFSRFIPSVDKDSEMWMSKGLTNRLLKMYFSVESVIGRLLPLPFGSSFICAARKC